MARKLGRGQKSLERGSTFKVPRAAMRRKSTPKRTQPKRDWTEARAKVEREEVCRLGRDGGCEGKLEAAHVIGRESDLTGNRDDYIAVMGGKDHWVMAERIVPLCTRHHHMYDRHKLDLLGVLTPEEEAQAVLDAGGLELARRRVAPLAYGTQFPGREAPCGPDASNPRQVS